MLLATDPDIDRAGITVMKGGEPVLLTGNEVGILLLDYVCEMARWYRAKGMDLVDAMEALYARYGYYRNGLISLSYPGAEGPPGWRRLRPGCGRAAG